MYVSFAFNQACTFLLGFALLQHVSCFFNEPLVCGVLQCAEEWTSHTPDCHVFSVLLLKCPGHTLQKLLPQALCIIGSTLQEPDR